MKNEVILAAREMGRLDTPRRHYRKAKNKIQHRLVYPIWRKIPKFTVRCPRTDMFCARFSCLSNMLEILTVAGVTMKGSTVGITETCQPQSISFDGAHVSSHLRFRSEWAKRNFTFVSLSFARPAGKVERKFLQTLHEGSIKRNPRRPRKQIILRRAPYKCLVVPEHLGGL